MQKKFINIIIIFVIIGIIFLTIPTKTFISTFKSFSYPIRYSEDIDYYCDLYHVEKSYIYALIKTESHFFTFAKSSHNCRGLMQISPETWEIAKKDILINDENDYYNKSDNIHVGIWYFSKLLNYYNNINYAILAYNAGPTTVNQWIEKNYLKDKDYLNWNIPYPESRNYLYKIVDAQKYYRKLLE